MANKRTAYAHDLRIVARRPLSFYTQGGVIKSKKEIGLVLRQLAEDMAMGDGGVSISGRINSTAMPVHACAFGNYASSADTVGFVVNGTTVTVTWATSDIASMTATVAAINADATASIVAQATNYVCTVALASVVANSVITVLGVPFTAYNGTTTDENQFNMSGNDAADAAALGAKIAAHPQLAGKVAVDVATATIYIAPVPWVSLSRLPGGKVEAGALTTFTITNGTFAAAADCAIVARNPGATANAMACTATGTNVTIIGSRTAFANGAGFTGTSPAGASFYVAM